jgi:hypothetical protein
MGVKLLLTFKCLTEKFDSDLKISCHSGFPYITNIEYQYMTVCTALLSFMYVHTHGSK